jgi:hypothetical protein
LTIGGCGAFVLGYSETIREEAPPLPAPLEADYRQVAAERGIEWELLAAWDGAANGFQLPVPSQSAILADLVGQELEKRRKLAEQLCEQHPSDPAYCPPPSPVLEPEEMDQLAQTAYRHWHALVRQHIGEHADWIAAHRPELDADLEAALRSVLDDEKAAMAAELHDGYVLLGDLDQIDDHTVELPADGPPADWQPVDGFAWPAEGPLTSRFGMRVSPIDGKRRLHAGIDLGVATGTPVRASKDGTVVRAEWDDVFGNVVVLDNGGEYQTLYAHNSQLAVHVGEAVRQGQVISYSGTTGWSTGPHLHFEIHYHGAPVDPLLLLGR